MAASTQQMLPIVDLGRATRTRITATQARVPQPVRWGSAVVATRSADPVSGRSSLAWQEVSNQSRDGRRKTVWVSLQPPADGPSVGDGVVGGGAAFARNRIHHALELGAACMLIAAAMATAMFV